MTSWRGVSVLCLFTLELFENTASDNNVSTGVSGCCFYLSNTEKIWSMAGVSDITVYTLGYLQVKLCLPSTVSNC